MNLLKRLEAAIGPDRECWLWRGKLDAAGRGRIWVDGKLKLAHRAVWELKVGPIPPGALLCHHCDNPTCVNPKHMYVGTPKSNVRDMMVRKRHWTDKDPARAKEVARRTGSANTHFRGSGNPKAKLTAQQVTAIRADTRKTKVVAAEYGVDRTMIQRIRNGKMWNAQEKK